MKRDNEQIAETPRMSVSVSGTATPRPTEVTELSDQEISEVSGGVGLRKTSVAAQGLSGYRIAR
ncbi:hypothetical protein UC34_22460 [Pandoraea vervacti]|uniref:Bacteriocin n=2 Tax=Pandoraea vervacti TaxID=656178 RepID=A0ABM5T231_9BURK|nr:hypothetical protein UC34_22460 [Pandoraea vervacti]